VSLPFPATELLVGSDLEPVPAVPVAVTPDPRELPPVRLVIAVVVVVSSVLLVVNTPNVYVPEVDVYVSLSLLKLLETDPD